jgi:hypothetical protein
MEDMKIKVVRVVGSSVLVVALAIGLIIVRPALAQVDASSTSVDTATSSTTTGTASATTSTDAATTTDTDTNTGTATTTGGDAATPVDSNVASQSSPQMTDTSTEPPPAGLTLVHIVGTKYVDYFTDGTTVTAYPGDPAIDSHFSEKDAPIPTHEGLTWVHTTGQYLYDTPSGDLEIGQYAVQPIGGYITNAPAFVSSTSTPTTAGDSTTTAPDTTSTADSSSSTPQSDSPVITEQGTSSTSTETGDGAATTTP